MPIPQLRTVGDRGHGSVSRGWVLAGHWHMGTTFPNSVDVDRRNTVCQSTAIVDILAPAHLFPIALVFTQALLQCLHVTRRQRSDRQLRGMQR